MRRWVACDQLQPMLKPNLHHQWQSKRHTNDPAVKEEDRKKNTGERIAHTRRLTSDESLHFAGITEDAE